MDPRGQTLERALYHDNFSWLHVPACHGWAAQGFRLYWTKPLCCGCSCLIRTCSTGIGHQTSRRVASVLAHSEAFHLLGHGDALLFNLPDSLRHWSSSEYLRGDPGFPEQCQGQGQSVHSLGGYLCRWTETQASRSSCSCIVKLSKHKAAMGKVPERCRCICCFLFTGQSLRVATSSCPEFTKLVVVVCHDLQYSCISNYRF
mmetsp:Transcript_25443/g.72957  ORF Transcript_25443/g.72957 Transcript_25443/m.72957 type:complete len:202 (-) Transcript_25443:1407-2012(-)